MNIPKQVIQDLLPLYVAGELSPETRAWLDELIGQDREWAAELQRHREAAANLNLADLPPLKPEVELVALKRTRWVMVQMRWSFALGIAFSAISLATAISFRPFRIRPLLLDYPEQMLPCLVIGIIQWIIYFRLRHRLKIGGVNR